MKEQKKLVLYVSANGYLGGAERVVLNLAKGHLAGSRFRPVIVFFGDGEAYQEARSLGVECVLLNKKFRLSDPWALFVALREFRAIIRKYNVDLIHSTMPYAHIVSSLAGLGLPVKKVWFQHGPVGGLLDKIATLFEVDWMFFNSHYLLQKHAASFPQTKLNQGNRVIPLGIAGSTPRKILSGRMVRFGTAGRITRGKAFQLIIQSFEALGLPYRLTIAGAPKGPDDRLYLKELEDFVSSKNAQDRVSFLGHQEDMSSFYQSIDVFIHASLTPEPFGLVIAEAMAHGCLVIGKAEGGARDFLLPGLTALTYASDDELKSAIATLIQGDAGDKGQLLAREGQRLIQKNYSVEQMTEVVEELYLSL